MLKYILALSPLMTFVVAISLIITYFTVDYLLDPLRNIPGPFLARFTRLWYLNQIYRGHYERTNIELHKKHGPIVRIAPREYSIDDVQATKEIYGHGNTFIKAPWYHAWSPTPTQPSLFSERDAHAHAQQRRKFASAYSMSTLVSYERFVDNCSTLLIARLHELSTSPRPIDIFHWLQCYAFDVIGEITFGARFGLLDSGVDTAAIFAAIANRSSYGAFVGVYPALHRWLLGCVPATPGHAAVNAFSLRMLDARELQFRDPDYVLRAGAPDFMTKFLESHVAAPEKMSRVDMLSVCRSNIGAGSDTTAIALSSIVYHLMKYPATYWKLREEVCAAEKQGRISSPVTFKESTELPYLQAVIKEALRIHPSVGLGLQRIVPPGGLTVAGRYIPAGSTVGVNAWVAHRNRSVFGDDADEWRPERWLEIEEDGRGAEVEKYFLAFGMGSRTCIGKNISLLEMGKLVPELIKRFEFGFAEGGAESVDSYNVWFVKQIGFWGWVREVKS